MTDRSIAPVQSSLVGFSKAVSIAVVFAGVVVLVGWVFDIAALKTVLPELVAMNPLTALGLIVCGMALWLLQAEDQKSAGHRTGRWLSLAVVAMGLAKMASYFHLFDLDVDVLLFRGKLAGNVMAPNTALSFVFIGLALYWLDMETKRGNRPSELLAILAGFICLAALFGYAFGDESLYTIGKYIPMALHAAAAMGLLALGILCARPGRGLMRIFSGAGMAGTMLRRFFPVVVFAPALLSWFQLKGVQHGYFPAEIGVALHATGSVAILSVLIWWWARLVHRADTRRQQAEDELRQLNETLEQRVQERTAELERTSRTLRQSEEHCRALNSSLEERVEERTRQLAEANKELEAFSYSVSHDLRAPLRHVQGYVEMLTNAVDGQLSDKAKRYLKTITEAAVEMGQLIDDLLAFSRMGRVEMRETQVSLEAMVRDIQRGLEMETKGRNIVWKIGDLPEVNGDPASLKQALANLAGNAVKYSRQRDPAVIEIGCAGEEDGRAIFFVRDNGAGFDMKYAQKLYGVFQRLHRPEEFEGTGIGLAIVRRVIVRHGGRTWAEGELNKGATFYFTLEPAVPAKEDFKEEEAMLCPH